MSVSIRVAGILAIIGLLSCNAVRADSYPNHVVKIVAAATPGNAIDVMARLLADQLGRNFNQSFIVENKSGASNMVGAEYVSSSKADGYTLLFAASTLATAPALMASVPIDVGRDLTPISMVVENPNIMVASPIVPVANPRELVAWVKQHPNDFRWGIAGVGSPDHLSILMFDKAAGINPQIITKATRAPLAQVLSGEISAILTPPASVKSYINAGQLRGLGIASRKMVDVMPGMPTVASFGFPGFESGVWFGVWGPKDMPKEIANEIQQGVAKALAVPALQEKMRALGAVPTPSKSTEAFAAYFNGELVRYSALIQELDIHISN